MLLNVLYFNIKSYLYIQNIHKLNIYNTKKFW